MEERRNDVELKVIAERVDNLLKDVAEEKVTSLEWRKLFCAKLDAVNMKLDALALQMSALPCPQRAEITKNIHQQLRGLWIAVSAIILGIVAEWVRMK